MSKLSNYFKYSEITHSNTAKANGLKNECCTTKAKILACRLDLVRFILGVPMVINSGYRSPDVNKMVGGSNTSAHMSVLACDFVPKGMDLNEAFNKIRNSGISFDQLIIYPKQNFIHIGFKENIVDERKQVLTK